jgi:arylsulfatase
VKSLGKSAALAPALAGALWGCADRTPVRLLERAEAGLVAPVELGDETRRALSVDLGSRVDLDLDFPEEPVLSFAIGASSRDRPTLLVPVVFRALVDGIEVFREEIRRSEGRKWFFRTVDLGPRGGISGRLSLEALRGEGGIEGAERHVVAHWGNPVVRSRHPRRSSALILISIDCLRADHVSAYGYPRKTTPNLDAFAREAALFRNAVSVSSYTLPTHASMLTGLPPSLHGAASRGRISSDVDTLPELLAADGYHVQGVVSAPFLAPVYGFADGFHTYRLSSDRAAGLVDQALSFLEEGAGLPQFLFLHLFDVHAPYSPPGEFLDLFGERPKDVSALHSRIQKRTPPGSEAEIQQAKNLYDAEIAYVDRELGRFFEELRGRGLYDRSVIIVTADHGEAFYEHGSWEHGRPFLDDGPGLFQEIVHVPLLVKAPGARGEVVEDVVSQADIFATFLEAARSRGTSAWARSLLDPREAEASRWTVSEFVAAPSVGGSAWEVALRRRNMKYSAVFRAHDREELSKATATEEALYDLAADPGERRNLMAEDAGDAERRETVASAREALELYRQVVLERRGQGPAEGDLSLDPELLEKLESLGYVEH